MAKYPRVLGRLLAVENDAKTIKGTRKGFLTGILYLAPGDLSGFEVCAGRHAAGCSTACLYTAGRGAMANVQSARIAKTVLFFEDRARFMGDLAISVRSLSRKAGKRNLRPAVRLNGTSDIRWERIPVEVDGIWYPSIMAAFPEVQFYDYTKDAARLADRLPANYDLTFSYSGRQQFAPAVRKAIQAGARIAVVFRDQESIPTEYLGLPVIAGDESDLRFLEPTGCVVALYAKGDAKKDQSGFVVDTRIIPIRIAA